MTILPTLVRYDVHERALRTNMQPASPAALHQRRKNNEIKQQTGELALGRTMTIRARERSGIGAENGAERADNRMSGSGAVSECEKTTERERSEERGRHGTGTERRAD